MTVRILKGDCREVLRTLPDESVHCVVTSPPYWGLRDYGVDGQIGLETTPEAFTDELVSVFREMRRVLRSDGTAWLNLGDSYSGSGKGGNPDAGKQATNKGSQTVGVLYGKTGETARQAAVTNVSRRLTSELGYPPKQLMGIPWRVAFALQADGWYLRQDIIWSKPNPMPESVRDRCTKAHEYLFLLSKSARYHYDAEAIAEKSVYQSPTADAPVSAGYSEGSGRFDGNRHRSGGFIRRSATKQDLDPERKRNGSDGTAASFRAITETRNKRSVWEIPTAPYADAHFATFPPGLIEPCILAGCPKGGTVLDPFGGAGTTGMVADRLERNAILIELNPAYAEMAERRIHADAGMFAKVAAE
jgi:DNA modification methylase